MSRVTVIIVNWNGMAFAEACLRSLREQTVSPAEVIIVDNASVDGSPRYIAERFPEMRLIRNQYNLGYAAANNFAIARSSGDQVLFLNLDTVLKPQFVESLSAALDADLSLGSVCGKLYAGNSSGTDVIDSVGITVTPERYVVELGQGQTDRGQFEQPARRFGGSGAAVLYRRRTLDDLRIGGEYFDSTFFAYNEDVDLAWRSILLGWCCRYLPQAVGSHRRGGIAAVRTRWLRRLLRVNYYSMLMTNEIHLGECARRTWRRRLHELLTDPDPLLMPQLLSRFSNLAHKRRAVQSRRRISRLDMERLMAA